MLAGMLSENEMNAWNETLLDVPEIVTVAPASMTPLFGRTQYLRGAVVFTLKHTLLSEGFFSLRLVVTTSVKGPGEHKGDRRPQFVLIFHWQCQFKHVTSTTPNKNNQQKRFNCCFSKTERKINEAISFSAIFLKAAIEQRRMQAYSEAAAAGD